MKSEKEKGTTDRKEGYWGGAKKPEGPQNSGKRGPRRDVELISRPVRGTSPED